MLALLLSVAFASEPIRVFVIDTGTDKIAATKDYFPSGQKFTTSGNHGTAMTNLIINGDYRSKRSIDRSVVVEVCDIEYNKKTSNDSYAKCLKQMVKGQYDFVNISLAGEAPSDYERSLIMLASHHSKIVVAAGNEAKNIDVFKTYPADYRVGGYVTTVGAIDPKTGYRLKSSNYGSNITYYQGEAYTETNGSIYREYIGTSVAAALYTHYLILLLQTERRSIDK